MKLSERYEKETGRDPVVMNQVAYSREYVIWLESLVVAPAQQATNSESAPCGGFAWSDPDWYCPNSWDCGEKPCLIARHQ